MSSKLFVGSWSSEVVGKVRSQSRKCKSQNIYLSELLVRRQSLELVDRVVVRVVGRARNWLSKLVALRWKLVYFIIVACVNVWSSELVAGVVIGGSCQSLKLVTRVGHVKAIIRVCRQNLVTIVTDNNSSMSGATTNLEEMENQRELEKVGVS